MRVDGGTFLGFRHIPVSTCTPKVSESEMGSFPSRGERQCLGMGPVDVALGDMDSGGLGSAGSTIGIDGLRALFQSE